MHGRKLRRIGVVTASATVYCSWYGAVEISNVDCGHL